MGDRNGKVEPLTINTIPGKTAPRFDAHTTELTPLHATITERGMTTGLPMVDFVFEGADDKRYAFTTSGRMLLMLAAAVQAVIIRQGREPDYVPVIVEALRGKHEQSDFMTNAANALADALYEHIAPRTDIPFEITKTDLNEAVRLALIDVLVK